MKEIFKRKRKEVQTHNAEYKKFASLLQTICVILIHSNKKERDFHI